MKPSSKSLMVGGLAFGAIAAWAGLASVITDASGRGIATFFLVVGMFFAFGVQRRLRTRRPRDERSPRH